MTVIDRPLRMPKLAFLTAWELQGLGTPHPVVGTNDLYMTDDFRAEVQRRTLSRLAESGLAADGALHPRFRNTLAAIADAGREFYAWSNFRNGDSGAILVAGLGNEGVRLITDGTSVHLDPVDGDHLAERLVETLPDVPGARVRPISVTDAEYRGDTDTADRDPLAEPTDARRQADRLRELMRSPRDAVHQIYAGLRDNQGRRQRSVPLSAIDLAGHGRVLTYLNNGRDGQDVINLVSGTPAKLTSTLYATLNGL